MARKSGTHTEAPNLDPMLMTGKINKQTPQKHAIKAPILCPSDHFPRLRRYGGSGVDFFCLLFCVGLQTSRNNK